MIKYKVKDAAADLKVPNKKITEFKENNDNADRGRAGRYF